MAAFFPMLLCSLLVLARGEEEPKLKLAIVLFRHGDRSPVVTLPIDSVPVSSHHSLAGCCQCIMVTLGSLLPPSLSGRYLAARPWSTLCERDAAAV